MKNRGQMNIFIIAGVILIVIIVLLFFYRGKLIPQLDFGKETNPNIFFESCIAGKVKEAIAIMSPQGGYIEPEFSFGFKFEKEKHQNISYLCYTENNYIPCVNQEPMLIRHLKDEIKNYILEDVENCFDDLMSNLEKQDYVVNSSYEGFGIELIPKKILVNIYGKIILTKTGETSKQKNFEVRIPTMFYNLAVVAQEIVSQEAKYCHFEQMGLMLLNPEFELDKFKTGDSKTIYTLKHRKSGESFRFAVRGCVMPAGM